MKEKQLSKKELKRVLYRLYKKSSRLSFPDGKPMLRCAYGNGGINYQLQINWIARPYGSLDLNDETGENTGLSLNIEKI